MSGEKEMTGRCPEDSTLWAVIYSDTGVMRSQLSFEEQTISPVPAGRERERISTLTFSCISTSY